MNRVLLVDDDPQIVRAVRVNLSARGYTVTSAYTGRQALAEAVVVRPDVVVLDLGLPDLDGVAVITDLRRWTPVPIVVLSGRAASGDKVEALDAGADDYVTKPFSVRELVLRLKAVVRRGGGGGRSAEQPREQVGPIRVDVDAHRAFTDDVEIELTPLEFRLLSTFMARLGRVQSREQLLEDVWEMSPDVETRTVDTHVKRLREKLGTGRDLLETVRGIGYRMIDPADKGQ
jgi:two-component system phosphate regulon response regulator PhoB